MPRAFDDPSRHWLRGIEHAMFDPKDWAVQTLAERMIESTRSDPDNTARYGQAVAVNQQFKLLLTYQRQWAPSPSVVNAYEQVYELTRSMAQELDLNLDDMNRYLLTVAVEHEQTWALDLLLPRCTTLLNQRDGQAARPGGWLLTLAARLHRFEPMQRLLDAGARWEPDGKKVLTVLPCDHPDHPALNDRDQPWWAVLYNDERIWSTLTTDLVKDEFFAEMGEKLALARTKLGPEGDWFMDFFTDMGLSNARQLERWRETGVDAVEHAGHRLPSREVILADIVLAHQPMNEQAWSMLDRMGIVPSSAEQEALMTLRIRQGKGIQDLGWSPDVHEGRALWALLDQARWSADSSPKTTGWNGAGQAMLRHVATLHTLAERDDVHPVERWWHAVANERLKGHWYGGNRVSEQVDKMTSTCAMLFAGLDEMEALFPEHRLDRAPWAKRLNDWMVERLSKEYAPGATLEERALRMVDLQDRIAQWGRCEAETPRPTRARPRL